jgi:hypothetical protein
MAHIASKMHPMEKMRAARSFGVYAATSEAKYLGVRRSPSI